LGMFAGILDDVGLLEGPEFYLGFWFLERGGNYFWSGGCNLTHFL
jgi:hypothetical protein